MKRVKELVLPPLVLLLICAVVSAALAGTNLLTKDKIQSTANKTQRAAMAELVDADSFKEQVLSYDGADVTYYQAVSGKNTLGYIFITSSQGYGGEVKVMTAVGTGGSVISMKVLAVDSETPGLGTNALNADWWGQFSGMSGSLAVKKDGGNVDALTGATITSRAVVKAVNTALAYFDVLEAK